MKIRIPALWAILGLILAFPRPAAAQWEKTSGPDKPSVGALLASGAKLFAGTAGRGVFLTEDDGATWRMISEGIPARCCLGYDAPPRITCFVVMGDILYAGTEYCGVFRTTDGGATWKQITKGFALEDVFREMGAPPETWISGFSVIGTKLFAGQTDFGVFELMPSGESWKMTAAGMPDEPCVISLATDGAGLYAGTELASVYRLPAPGKKWQKLSLKLPDGTRVGALLASGKNVFAGTTAGLFRTSDQGKKWQRLERGLPEDAPVLALVASGSSLFAGCGDEGVFVSADGGESWAPLDDDLKGTRVLSLAASATYLFAGTEAFGVWRRPLTGSAPGKAPAPEPPAAVENAAAGLAVVQEDPLPKLLRTTDIAGADLSVAVWDHKIETRDGMLRCWTYVSKGMEKHGQREIVFTVRQTPDLRLHGFPEEVFDLFGMIFGAAADGNTVNDRGFTVYRRGVTLLGRAGNWGLMYLPAESFEGLGIPPNALAAILVRDHETELVHHGLHYRVATAMAGAYRYFPYPPWSDPDRAAMTTEDQFGKSLLSKIPVRTVFGIRARTSVEQSVPAELRPQMVDGKGSFGSEIVLSIDRKSLPDIRKALDEVPEEGVCAWLTDPDLEANSRLHWDADSANTVVLQPPSGPGNWTTGGFIILGRAKKELKPKVRIIEDGFMAVLEAGPWKALSEALAAGLPVEIPGRDKDWSLRIEFAREDEGVKGKAAAMTRIVLFNTDEDFAKIGIGAYTLSGYMDDILNAVSAVLDGYPELGAEGLLVAVAVRPGSKVKVWCEAAEEGFDPAVSRKIEAELEKVRPPSFRAGTMAFSVSGPRWPEAAAGGSSGFPKAWTDVVNKANKPVTVDEIIAALWKD